MPTKRDKFTIDMFTGNVDPEIIPPSRALVAKPKKSSTPSVPSVPLADVPTPLVAKPDQTTTPPPNSPGDITLFPHSYLIVLGLAWITTVIIIADNLYDAGIVASAIKARAHIPGRLDQYLIATMRGGAAAFIAFFTICCGVHIAVRRTALPLIRYSIAAFFLVTAAVLIVVAYICEHDYMAVGLPDIMRRLGNIAGMRW
jgi:hypothetical protein